MAASLAISIGQFADKGRKEVQQDFHGALVPQQPALTMKGIAIAIADGISTSAVSHIAAQSAVKSFLTDYYCTSDAWTVKTSAQRVIAAANSWLHAQNRFARQNGDMDRGYVCTLSVMVLKSRTAHIFHIGDSRIYRLHGNALEQLTTDHRIVVSSQQNYLARALGINPNVEIDYSSLTLAEGDMFLLATDGVAEGLDAAFVSTTITNHADDLDKAAEAIARNAYDLGCNDNLTVQIVRVDRLPLADAAEVMGTAELLPPPAVPKPGDLFDGWRIVRNLHASSRSHVFEAEDGETGERVALKVPSVDLSGDTGHLRRLVMEEWVARRLSNPHLLAANAQDRPRNYLYNTLALVPGTTLADWMVQNSTPDLATVRAIIGQIGVGLQAMHRRQMVHQDLRPQNVIIGEGGHVTLIDFGATKVAGVNEAAPFGVDDPVLGTQQYAAPEYFLGETGTDASDIYSLGVIAYQMLTGELPYGAAMARTKTRGQQRSLHYRTAAGENSFVPVWVDAALRRAVHFDPFKRYDDVSEFVADLTRPNPALPGVRRLALAERDPVRFWQAISFCLALAVIAQFAWQVLR